LFVAVLVYSGGKERFIVRYIDDVRKRNEVSLCVVCAICARRVVVVVVGVGGLESRWNSGVSCFGFLEVTKALNRIHG